MILTIFCEDDTKQVINLHTTFALDKIGNTKSSYLLSFGEVNKKALSVAQSVVGEALYRNHLISGYDEDAQDLRSRNQSNTQW